MYQFQAVSPALSISTVTSLSNSSSLSKINLFWEVNQDFEKFYQYLDPFPAVHDVENLSMYSISTQSSYASGDLGSLTKVGIYRDFFDRDMKMDSFTSSSVIDYDCLSHLTKHPVTKQNFIAKIVLRNKGLHDLNALGNHLYIQCLDLAHNFLRDVNALGKLRYLMNLDLSHNLLTATFNFKAPWYLTHVDLSHNFIEKIHDLSEYWSLVYLDLSYNRIKEIIGLRSLKHLRYLDLSNNQITEIENLKDMNLLQLNLSFNKISSDGKNALTTLKRLKELNLEHNEISSLAICANIKELQVLLIGDNNIANIVELTYLRGLLSVVEASFVNNQVSSNRFYRNVVFDTLRGIRKLDGQTVTAKDKVYYWPQYNRCPRIRAINIYRFLKNLEIINGGPKIGPHIRPCDENPFPLVVLVGPLGCGKSSIAFRIQCEFPRYIYWANIYTTAEKSLIDLTLNKDTYQNNTRLIHITTDLFHCKLKNGDFLAVTDICGASYGFCSSELAKAIVAKKLCLLTGDVTLAFQLKLRRLFPYIIPTMPKSNNNYVKFLVRKYRSKIYMYDALLLKMVGPIIINILENFRAGANESLELKLNEEIPLLEILFSVHNTYPSSNFILSSQKLSQRQSCTLTRNSYNKTSQSLARENCTKLSKTAEKEQCDTTSQQTEKHSIKRINISDRPIQHEYHTSWSKQSYSSGNLLYATSVSQTCLKSPNLSVNTASFENDDESSELIITDPMIDFTNYCTFERDTFLKHSMKLADTFTKIIWTDDITLAIAAIKPILQKAYRSGSNYFQNSDNVSTFSEENNEKEKVYFDDLET